MSSGTGVDLAKLGATANAETADAETADADPVDAVWLGLACGALVVGLGSDAGIENFGQVLVFLSRTQPAVASRIAARSRLWLAASTG